MTLTRDLAEIIVKTAFEDIPKAAIEIARQACLDAIGTTIAGADEPTGIGRITIDYTRLLGGTPEASVFTAGLKTSVLNAAYANGTMCHALDFDNTWWPRNHPASPSIPAILAMAERDRLPGRQILLAIVLAFEVQGRMRVASAGVISGGDFHHPGISGTMGAATGVGKLLGLNAQQMCMAYGIAGSRCGALTANHGTMTKPSHSGIGARMGTEAALLAGLGFTGADDIFGKGEFFRTFYGTGNTNLDLLLKDFGSPFRMVDPGVSFKRYPSKYFTHRTIEAAIHLAAKHDLQPDEIERVEVDYPPTQLVDRPAPITGLEGKTSLQYCAAAGLLDRKVTIATFTDKRRFAGDMQTLLPKVALRKSESIPTDFPNSWIVVRVYTRDSQVLEERCNQLKGMAGNPLSREELLEKFYGCVESTLTQDQAEEVVAIVDRMAELENIERLMEIVRQRSEIQT